MLCWMNHKLESRLPGNISTNSDMQIITLMAESDKELKSLLMRVKEESEKLASNSAFKELNHSIFSPRFVANRWENSGSSDRFYFLGL